MTLYRYHDIKYCVRGPSWSPADLVRMYDWQSEPWAPLKAYRRVRIVSIQRLVNDVNDNDIMTMTLCHNVIVLSIVS